jgi:hypothetical protein
MRVKALASIAACVLALGATTAFSPASAHGSGSTTPAFAVHSGAAVPLGHFGPWPCCR